MSSKMAYCVVDFRDRARYRSPVGSRRSPKFVETIDDLGCPCLKISGETDNYNYIQASYPATQIYSIIDRFLAGDLSALQKSVGRFVDATGLPSNLHEANKMIMETRAEFARLPADLRSAFGGSVDGLLAAMSDGRFDGIMQNYQKNHSSDGRSVSSDPSFSVQNAQSEVTSNE